METNENAKKEFLEETVRNLIRAGIVTAPLQGDTLSVTLGGRPLCQIGGHGVVRVEDAGEERQAVLDKVLDIVRTTGAYMAQLEHAGPLEAKGLEDGYKLLAEFGGTVLAGRMTRYGAQFVTWDWTYDRTGLWQGHYYVPGSANSYPAAKRDFAIRSGLIPASALFAPEELTEIYRGIRDTLDSDELLADGRRELLESAAGKIERSVPDLTRRIDAREEAPGMGGMHTSNDSIGRREEVREELPQTMQLTIAGCPLALPVAEGQLEQTLRALGIEASSQAEIAGVRYTLLWLDQLIPTDGITVEGANDLALRLQQIEAEHEMERYCAALDVERPSTFTGALDIAMGLDDYELVTASEQEYGKEALHRLGMDSELLDTLDDCADFYHLGRAMMDEDGVRETAFGLVRRLSSPFPPEPKIGQTML